MLKRQEKLTLAAIVTRDTPLAGLEHLEALARELSNDWEILLVATGMDQARVMELTRIVHSLRDATLHILDDATPDVARLAVLDTAIGDRILTVDLAALDAKLCRQMLDLAGSGFEVVLSRRASARAPSLGYRLMRGLFVRLYGFVSGVRIEHELPLISVYSRSAAVHLLSRREAEMLLRTSVLGDAFPGTQVELSQEGGGGRSGNGRQALARAYRALNFAGALPLRLVVLLCGLSAVVNLFYMKFAIISRLMEDVAPGWTTLSLQISGMFLLLSVILGIIAEHLIAVDRAVNRRPRYRVLREVRSTLSKAWQQRNVVGTF